MIKKGQQVHIKPEWQDEGDSDHVWIAVEDEVGDRIRIAPLMLEDFAIQPITLVEVRMLVESDAAEPSSEMPPHSVLHFMP